MVKNTHRAFVLLGFQSPLRAGNLSLVCRIEDIFRPNLARFCLILASPCAIHAYAWLCQNQATLFCNIMHLCITNRAIDGIPSLKTSGSRRNLLESLRRPRISSLSPPGYRTGHSQHMQTSAATVHSANYLAS